MKCMLIKCRGKALTFRQLQPAFESAGIGVAATAEDSIAVYQSVTAVESYVYIWLSAPTPDIGVGSPVAMQEALRMALAAAYPMAEVIQLECTLDVSGSSAGKPGSWHYVVETDVRAEAEEDFNAWYSTEHLPGLAAVPGAIRARRYVSPGHSPKHHAAYDLETQETFGSKPWLEVRGTEWSSRVRPNFFNTKRTMFKKISNLA